MHALAVSEFRTPGKFIFGAGALASLGEEARRLGGRAVLVVGRKAMQETGIAERCLEILSKAGAQAILFEGVEPEPDVTTVDRCRAALRAHRADVVIGLGGGSAMDAAKVAAGLAGEDDPWSYTVGRGFFDQPELTTEEMDVGRAIFAMPGAMCYLAVVETGASAGGAALAIRHGLATLFADSTIAQFRCHGLHRELIAARLNEAIAQGCDMATASTLPGSVSQRNYERAGFEVVYTKVTLVA